MRRRRLSLRRLPVLLAALLLLVLLLEMGRWLPGGWPGGGSGGLRPVARTAAVDAGTLRPGTAPVEWPPPGGIRVELRAPDGSPLAGWRLGTGGDAPGEEERDGAARLRAGEGFRDGFRVERGGEVLRHRPAPPATDVAWVVHWPEGPLAGRRAPAPAPRTLRTRLVDPADGGPARGVEARWVPHGSEGRPLEVARDGAVEVEGSEADLVGGHLEVRSEGRPVVLLPEARWQDVTPVPAGETVAVRVTDSGGRRPAGAAATVRYPAVPGAAAPGGEPLVAVVFAEADAEGIARFAVPPGATVDVLAEGLERAPAARRLSAADRGDLVEMVLEAGLRVPVRVNGADGRAIAGAEVVAVADAGGVRVERRALTDGQGVAVLGPLPPGPAEVYAKAPGHAWGAATVRATSAAGTTSLRLLPGADLALVVETPEGEPVAGASVRLAPEDGGPPAVAPPGAPALRTDAAGLLRAEDLPDRPFTLRVSAPGFRPERVSRVRPGRATHFLTLVPE